MLRENTSPSTTVLFSADMQSSQPVAGGGVEDGFLRELNRVSEQLCRGTPAWAPRNVRLLMISEVLGVGDKAPGAELDRVAGDQGDLDRTCRT